MQYAEEMDDEAYIAGLVAIVGFIILLDTLWVISETTSLN